MGVYYENSLFTRILAAVYSCYLNSGTCKAFTVLLNWCRDSRTNGLLQKFLRHSSTLQYSKTYAICSNIFWFLDRQWDRFYNFWGKCLKSSTVISLFKKSLSSIGGPICLALFVLFFSCSYGVVSMLMGTFNNIKFVIMSAGILLSLFLPMGKSRWSACSDNSLFRRIFLYFFD